MKTAILIAIFIQSLFIQNSPEPSAVKSFKDVKKVQLKLKKCNVRLHRKDQEENTINIQYKESNSRLTSEHRNDILVITERDDVRYFSSREELVMYVPDEIAFEVSIEDGDLTIDQVKGSFRTFLHEGEINGSVSIKSASSFESESGDVNLKLLDKLNYNLSVASGSAKATLDFNGTPPCGRITASCFYPQGKIIAPFQFTREEITHDDRPDYLNRLIDLDGKNETKISLSTGPGTIEIKK